jgi:GT2 family glycosyltransferase
MIVTSDTARTLLDSEYFDPVFYGAEAGIAFADGLSAALHYVETGSALRRRPSPRFDPAYYLEANADIAESGMDPLLHFVRYGLKEGRRPALSRAPRAAAPLAPGDRMWTELAERLASRPPALPLRATGLPVDVIIPVYRGYDDTLACIESVLRAGNETPYELVVIDDRSPEPALSAQLERLAGMGLITLLKNPANLGFVGTVNRGMRRDERRDVILLNSDTIVYGDWIDRLRAQAYGGDRVATVTPWSNNATIFSYPHTLRSNNQTLEIDFPALDRLAARVNAGKSGTVPTGVGFCFYIRRDALAEIGPFDEDLFGKGYGEENDFCMRAIARGWINLAAHDVFVRHTGEVSFAAGASEGKREGFRRLVAAHPRYEGLIADYIRRDPMKPARVAMDVARFARASDGRGILMVEHGWGGGIKKHIEDLADLAAAEGIATMICTASADRRHGLRTSSSDDFPNLPSIDWSAVDEAAALLKSLNLGRVHLHSLVGYSAREVSDMLAAIRLAGLPYDFTVHDYAPICPRITMIDWGGSYCDTPSRTYCGICLERGGSDFGETDIHAWIGLYEIVFDGAEHIFVPSSDVAERLVRNGRLHYDYIVRPHPERDYPVAPRKAAADAHADAGASVRRIGIIGAIGPHKGSRLLRAMSADAEARRLPLQFIVYGYTDFELGNRYDNIVVCGKYRDEAFSEMHAARPCDIAFFSSMWPETFCYSLDHAFRNLIYPVAFSLGAPAERIRATGFGHVIDRKYMFSPSRLNDLLLALDIPDDVTVVTEPERAWRTIDRYYTAADWREGEATASAASIADAAGGLILT